MVKQPIKIILLFALFSLISSAFEIKTFEIKQYEGRENFEKSYSLKLSDLALYDYTNKFVQFTIKAISEKNQIVYFSDRNNNDCKDGRLLLALQPYGPINLIVPKDNIEGRFLCVECLEDDPSCKYSVEYKLLLNPKINPKEKYNYLLYNQGERVEFPTSDAIYNLWVKGINMTIDVVDNPPSHKSSKIKNGRIYQIMGKTGSTFTFKINGEQNDFITIGSTEIKNNEANELHINDLEIMGILTEDNKEICFPIKENKYIKNESELIYINGLVYTKKARTYFKYLNTEAPNTEKTIQDGSILELSNLNQILYRSYCISYKKDTKIYNEVVFTLQLSSYRHIFYTQLIYPPLIPGVIYPHYLLKDEIAVYQGLRPRSDAQEINFNMKSIKGFPDMFFHNCTTYPHCRYNDTKVFDITDPHQSNRMSVYSYYLKGQNKNISSIGAFQPLMIVQCKEGQTEKEKNTGYCIFETAIFTDKDRLQLKEADTFTQFLLKGEKDLYSIDFQFEENVEKVYLDVIVFSGDVNVTMEDEVSKIIAFKYFLANKIFYTFTKSYMGDSRKVIEFRVQAQKNSFYMIQYQLVRSGDQSVNTNIIDSGVNFVESIAVGENQANYKYVEIENHKIEGGAPFLASFYSKNCRFVISTETPNKSQYLDMIGNFGQIIIDKNHPIYYEDRYKFKIQAIDTDSSVYDSKLCMVYVSGLELNDKSSYTQKTISLSEGVPHSYIFTKDYTRMGYSYHLSDRSLPAVIDLNLIDKDIFKVDILFNYNNYKEIEVYRNLQVFIPTDILMSHCPEDEICSINVFITLKTFTKPRRIETTISQVNGAPTYLEKNTFKQDYIVGNYNKYYYFDIGEEERGDVTVYYKRNSGHIFGKIVSKLEVEEIQSADWRGIYQFPKSQNESTLEYDAYYQKLKIKDMNSKNCTFGCYVLLTIRASNEKQDVNVTSNVTDLVPYRITIIPRIMVKNVTEYNKFPKVKIPVNEYIIGDVDVKKHENGTKIESYNYYEIWLPYDSDLIYIDWQADKPQLLINVGPENPTVGSADFKFPSTDQDTVLRITKEEIIEALKKRGMQVPDNQTIRYFNLTIGIYTEKIDTLYSSVYAFKVFQPPIYQTKDKKEKAAFEIIHIRSDQKVLCDPAQIGACLFAVIFDEGDINNNLVLYPRPQNPNVEVKYYGDFVDASQVERNNLTYILENIKTDKSAKFNSESGKKFIYSENVERNKCLLLYVEVDISTIIEIFSSTSNNYQITPNPNTPQIFAIQGKELQLNFEEKHDLLINIVSVSGEGYFYWEDEKLRKFYLSGEGDRLSLTAKRYSNSTKLIAQSTQYVWTNSTDKSGFVFYITHYPRNSEYNMDLVKAGRSTEFSYRETKFPLNFFTKLTTKDVTVSFNFYDFYKGNELADFQYKEKLLKIWGTIITEEQAYKARSNQQYRPRENTSIPVYGTVDGPLGLLYLNQTDITQKFKIDPSKNYSLFFSVEMLNTTETNLTGVSLEVSVLGEQGRDEIDSVIPENVYINGKLTNNEYFGIFYLRYKLKVDKKNPYMSLEFSSSSVFVNWCVSHEEYTPENYTFPERVSYKINGRTIYKFKVPETPDIKNYLYLIIFNIDKQTIEPELSNFVFKYMNFKDNTTFYNFEQTSFVNMTRNDKDYIMTFKPGKNYRDGEELTYYVKGVYYDTINVDEIRDSIAISESKGIWRQLNNPVYKGNNEIEIKLENVDKELSHIKVMVKLKLNAIVEYLLYDIVNIHTDTKPESSQKYRPTGGYIEIIYNGTTKYTMVDFEAENENRYLQKYKLRFLDSYFIPKYLKVETISTSSDTNKIENQIIYFTKYGKREQLAQKGYGLDNVMWLKRNQFSYEVDIEVQCQNKQGKCAYTLQFSGHNEILIETSTLVYNYYITSENQEMDFKIKNEIEDLEVTGHFLTFYATGYKPVDIDVKNCYQCIQYKFRAGTAITVDLIKRKYFELTIKAQEGDFISVGSKYTLQDGRSPANTLNPNARQITGYLKRDVLEKECYLLPDDSNDKYIETYYLSILFYNRVAKLTFAGSNFDNKLPEVENIDNGHYTLVYNYKKTQARYLCVELPSTDKYSINDIPYTIQLTEPKSQVGLLNIYTPQLNGNIYPRITGKGSVVFFNAVPPTSNSKEQIYNMMALEGFPQMYIYKCKTYPLCDINIDSADGVIRPNEINGMTSWVNTQPKIYNPIQPEQYIMYVKCPEISNQENYQYCRFQTTILGNNDTVVLVEKQPFSQYILAGEPDSFLINFEFEKNIYKIFVDTLVISGDVSFTLKDAKTNLEIKSHKYYLGNKIFYSISKSNNQETKSIRVEIFAKKNSYYVVEYKLLKTGYDQTLNDVYAGINYLIPVPKQENENQKLLTINNVKLLEGNLYLTSFKSLNCRFEIKRVYKDQYNSDSYSYIRSYGTYAQELIKDKTELEKTSHKYQISVLDRDTSDYQKGMCMLYVSGLELTKEESPVQRELLVSQGVPQTTVFEDGLKKVRFVYPHTDKTKNIVIIFDVINPAKYQAKIIYNHNETELKPFTSDYVYYAPKETLESNCKPNEICTIIAEITAPEAYNGQTPIIETTIREAAEVPIYLPKGVSKRNYASGDLPMYFFTDIGHDDSGYISINFERGSFEVYAKVVEKNPTKTDEGANWRQYKFPNKNNKDDGLLYDFYNKKLSFTNLETGICKGGCYILISLRANVEGSLKDGYRFFPFTISVTVNSKGDLQKTGEIVEIHPEEYVIGFLDKKEKYEYYQINIPFDADGIDIDFQSDVGILLVSYGNERPTFGKKEKIIIFNNTKGDTIYQITREELKSKLGIEDSIDKKNLILGVYSEDFDSLYGTVYSFKVHFYRKTLNIHKVNSDHKTLCKPEKINNEYRCLYMIKFGELDFINDVMIYANSQSKTATTYMRAKFIKKEFYDKFDTISLASEIPDSKNAEFDTKLSNLDFIFATLPQIESHLFVCVMSNEPEVIELVSSFVTFDKEFTPNPSTRQILPVKNEKYLKLNFKTQKGLLINLVSIYGEAKLYWDKEQNVKYHLRGRDDRISFALADSYADGKVPSLIIDNKDYMGDQDQELRNLDENMNTKNETPTFAFYLEYYLRSPLLNFDEANIGKTTEFVYDNADFPFYYYSKLNNLNKSVNIFFNFHDILSSNSSERDNRTRVSQELKLQASVIKQNAIYKVTDSKKPEVKGTSMVGVYDPALQTGYINFPASKLGDFNVKANEKPTLYIEVIKDHYKNYKNIRLELSVIQENSDIVTTEKLYQFGKIENKTVINSYRLRVDKNSNFMRIQFSANNPNIKYVISEEKNSKIKANYAFNITKDGGKEFITFKRPNKDFIYLNVYCDEKPIDQLSNYVFKYINSKDVDKFFEYVPKEGNKLEISKPVSSGKGKNKITAKFKGLYCKNNRTRKIKVTYVLKVVYGTIAKSHDPNENKDSIAICESGQSSVMVKDPKEDDIKLELDFIIPPEQGIRYTQLIGIVNDGPINEYYSYGYKDDYGFSNKGKSGSSPIVIAIITISIILFIIIVILIIIVFAFSARNKNLMNKVNAVSFVDPDEKGSPLTGTNLLMEGKNELE